MSVSSLPSPWPSPSLCPSSSGAPQPGSEPALEQTPQKYHCTKRWSTSSFPLILPRGKLRLKHGTDLSSHATSCKRKGIFPCRILTRPRVVRGRHSSASVCLQGHGPGISHAPSCSPNRADQRDRSKGWTQPLPLGARRLFLFSEQQELETSAGEL